MGKEPLGALSSWLAVFISREHLKSLISHFLLGNELQIKLDLMLLRKPIYQSSSEQNESFSAITLQKSNDCYKWRVITRQNPVARNSFAILHTLWRLQVKCLNSAWNSLRMLFIKAQLIKLRPLIKISPCKPNILPAKRSMPDQRR